MPTWAEVQVRARERYRVTVDEPEWLALRSEHAGEPPVRVKLELTQAWNEPWLLMLAEVSPAGTIDAAQALRQNASLALGALAIEGSLIVVRHTLRLATMSWADLDIALAACVEAARDLRRTMPQPTSALDYLIE